MAKSKLASFKDKKEEFQENIRAILEKPNKLLHKVMEDFGGVCEKVLPFHDFLDSRERKSLENFEEWISKYFRVLDNLKYSLANL